MSEDSLGFRWSQRFGLARSPMFAFEAPGIGGEHDVLLDGGHGSFGLSVVDERTDPRTVAGWAWSSSLPHHVTVSRKDVQVVRWDDLDRAKVYSLSSVDGNLDGFYRYLCEDRLRSNRTVVQHLVNLFGRVRTLVAHARLPDDRGIDAFLTVLADLIAGEDAPADGEAYGLAPDAAELRTALAGPSLDQALRDIVTAPAALSTIRLHPSLAIRHAGGQLFQEAHFDLVRAPSPDLFGYVETAIAEPRSRGGTHFTPPALARSVVDHTILQVDRLVNRTTFTVSDLACGSAAFLHEALRGLRRVGYRGALHVIGRDVSGPAIAMARFTLGLAARDWSPDGGMTSNLRVGDSLAEPRFPLADMTVMNPPFISVIAQSSEQKAQLRTIIGEKTGSRGDYSMAFVTRALDALADGGAMGALFPANLLTHEAATPWRQHLARTGDVRLLASIGDFGMFNQALIHVACAVIAKGGQSRREFTALVTENRADATGDALRELRKAQGNPPPVAVEDESWKLFATDRDALVQNRPWRILTPRDRRLLDALEAAQTPTVEQLFDIAQGVQTGNLRIFLYDEASFRRINLPPKERTYFRDALMTDSIEDGRIVKIYHMFYPHGTNGRLFSDEAAVRNALPTFYRTVLKPNEAALRARVAIQRSNRADWWGLMHPRAGTFGLDTRPRIISKFFGAEGSFVLDADARHVPSTGHVWTPKWDIQRGEFNQAQAEEDEAEVTESAREAVYLDVLRAYVALLNSSIFVRLVSFRSVTVSGGQFDLSSRFLSPVHVPDLWEKALDPFLGGAVRRLALVTTATERGHSVDERDRERLVAQLYGVPELVEG